MKKLILVFSLVMGSIIVVTAQDTTSIDREQQQYEIGQADQDRERINSRDLPDAIKRSLEAQEYRGWLINAAYKTTGLENNNMQNDPTQDTGVEGDTTGISGQNQTGAYGEEVFVVEMKNGAQTKTVRFNKDGERLDDGTSQDDQKK